MSITIRENMFRVYHHQVPEFLPMISDIQNIATLEPGFPCWIVGGEKPGKVERDWFGQNWVYESSVRAYNPDASDYCIHDITRWRDYITVPDPDSIDWEAQFSRENVQVDRDNKFLLLKDGYGLWERAFCTMPIVDLLCNLVEEPEACEDFFKTIADYKIKLHNYYIAQYRPDALCMHDDYGTGQGLFMSPETWRKLIKPHLQRVIANITDQGVIYQHHCCGMLAPIAEEIAEMGADAWENVHVVNNPLKCKEKFGNKLAFIGGVADTQMLDGDRITEEEIRNHIRKVMDEMLPGCGTVIYSACKAHPERMQVIREEMLSYGQQFFKEKRPE
ncbi:hypothetical protein GKG47_04030 [Lactonifactor sp. BIOML-A3]|uniref:uroporphyrinogen decarboxylase family protein n=1 Tax=unclassified Lactonifactor TaxID=2636670 RepID=UPI0012B04465|nr:MULTISPECIES: uroporphyrinogen decarboxylase family protein [unclassified Lactonifactor]MSA00783.1 hypothetical protein [Lactonifactor sp. BIOML-A5]MSA06981.1 hypothetical protein [Lactonifactor sp. BIOML-A4]MSA11620.1 hypothetical protein [Lactonifactor sp. BIOML-A3]MSA16213.1 hypothetical protein [Lactonifactor sp. BIOML-A2]MSA36817.1 hypothetical protein [Lactonifactor sp. BIOML-A1]